MGISPAGFIRGISAGWLSRLGAGLTTSSFIIFVIMEGMRLAGVVTNAYIGLITYLVFPALFVLGLLLIPWGWRIYSKRNGVSFRELLSGRFPAEEVSGGFFGSGFMRTVGLITVLNLVILGLVSFRTLHFMDTASFCGTACHRVMNPEWTTYQRSPHARVKCVECHVGEGFEALVDSKISGLRQIISLVTDTYPRPIPTPVHNLRPARETCEKCHWPDKFSGNRLRTFPHYGLDEHSTPVYNTLNLKIGAGEEGLDRGSHWHVAEKNQVRYLVADESRGDIIRVELRQADGSFKRFENSVYKGRPAEGDFPARVMDCVDCHNRATHIYEEPSRALDVRIFRGLLPADLPYIKREGLRTLSNDYPDTSYGERVIAAYIENFYLEGYPEAVMRKAEAVDSAAAVLVAVYRRNIHPYMKVGWGAYPSHLGHREGKGCFRCHNPRMVDESGRSISMDCTLCHSILAFESSAPFEYLFPADSGAADEELRRYLGEEFLRNY